jgi:hypothetical protein
VWYVTLARARALRRLGEGSGVSALINVQAANAIAATQAATSMSNTPTLAPTPVVTLTPSATM